MSIRAIGWRRSLGAVLALGGCAYDQMTPAEDDSLASAFEELAQEANRDGDPDAGSAFANAAMAVRLGIEPTEITVTVGPSTEQYRAFAHLVHHTRIQQSLSLRTLVAVRPRGNDDRRPAQVLYLATPVDSADLIHPMSLRPEVSAWGMWTDLVERVRWIGQTGKAGIVEESTDGPCPKVPPRTDVECRTAEFGAFIEGEFHAVVGGDRRTVSPDRSLTIRLRASGINGAELTF